MIFSELPEEAMCVVVDSILAPLNNWSDELIKFKVAAYPGRIYYGAIDKSKIDEQNLDVLFPLRHFRRFRYGGKVYRFLLTAWFQSRLDHFCSCAMDIFCFKRWAWFLEKPFFLTPPVEIPVNLGYFALLSVRITPHLWPAALEWEQYGMRHDDIMKKKIAPYFALSRFLPFPACSISWEIIGIQSKGTSRKISFTKLVKLKKKEGFQSDGGSERSSGAVHLRRVIFMSWSLWNLYS